MSSLLTVAIAQLNTGDPLANRRASWFARSALEDIVTELLNAKQVDVGRKASGRAKLSCLESLYREEDPDLAARAEYTWSRLSEACHQHAYRLAPTYAEVAHLIHLVGTLNRISHDAGD